MKHLFHAGTTLLFVLTILFAYPATALANEGDDAHSLETEVNGYHITLASQNEWTKGENIIVVTLTDSMGMPVSNTDVEILITPKIDGHAETEMDDSHGSEQSQDSMPGMDMGAPETEMTTHAEESANPISMLESDERGVYMIETHLETAGKHEVHVMFHVNGEMLQADFVVETAGTGSKTVVLWSFAAINVALVFSAGIIKKQKNVPVKSGG